MDDLAIKVENVSKTFKLPREKNNSIKSAVINFYKRQRGYVLQHALNDISFDVNKGEFFGIVGRNGSGKSTLLKILAGIYEPTGGQVHVRGSLTPFIELGVGFNMELTGRENVFLNGALLGFNRKDMEVMYKDIVEFAELEKFMDQKLKNYSSGMQVRLAFSIAIRAQSDILLIDEVLAVGDAAFQQKCFEVFSFMKKQGRTIVLVTHDMAAVLRFCDSALLIDKGKFKLIGKPKDIADAYLEINYQSETDNNAIHQNPTTEKKDEEVKINSVRINGSESKKTSLRSLQTAKINIGFENPKEEPLQFGLQIFNEEGNYCFGTNTKVQGLSPSTIKAGVIDLEVSLSLAPGNYTVTAAIMNADATKSIVYQPKALSFRIRKDTQIEGIANLEHKWHKAHI